MRDVTAIYANKINHQLRISADSLTVKPQDGETVYLCMSSQMHWLPVAYGRFKHDTIRIDNVEGSVIFKLAVCRNQKPLFISLPFLLEKYSGNIRFFDLLVKNTPSLYYKNLKGLPSPYGRRRIRGKQSPEFQREGHNPHHY